MTMAFLPLSTASPHTLQAVRLIATDMDGTLTQQGKFTATLLHALETLAEAGLLVVIVTGRSAGWVSALVHYLPVAGAIAENGGLFYPATGGTPQLLVPITGLEQHRQHLRMVFQHLKQSVPQLRESSDNGLRLTDWTFDIAGLTLEKIQRISMLCSQLGWGFTYSTVQGHIKPLSQDKGTGLRQVLQQHFPQISLDAVLTVGDSPNDESLFNPDWFPVSVGVANATTYRDQLRYPPLYLTHAAEAEGFCELANYLL